MTSVPELIRKAAKSLPPIISAAFGAEFDSFAQSRVVLIGGATHGTSEFYRARAAITKRLIQEHGFNIVAIEAGYPDASSIDRYVRLKPQMTLTEPAFSRFPTWLWKNTDVNEFVAWLRIHNSELPPDKRTGFYGLDLYNLYNSTIAVTNYLETVDAEAAKAARLRYGSLSPWIDNPQKYGLAGLTRENAPCEEDVVKVLVDLLVHSLEYSKADEESLMDAEQNAHLVADAEQYYRTMYYGDAHAWNLRDEHMFETLQRILAFKGESAKAVVWAHNCHVGDARVTGMGMERQGINIGQLCREDYGDNVSIIGFGTHTGTVAAADDWEQPMKVMKLNPSISDTVERLAHDSGLSEFMLDLRKDHIDETLRQALIKPRLERFIGVVYRPDTELWSHYSKVILSKQFDAYVWFDETSAVKPLPAEEIHHAIAADDTYPFGL